MTAKNWLGHEELKKPQKTTFTTQKCTTANTNIVGFIMPSDPTKTGEESMMVYFVKPGGEITVFWQLCRDFPLIGRVGLLRFELKSMAPEATRIPSYPTGPR